MIGNNIRTIRISLTEGESTPVHLVIINQHVNFLAKADGVRTFWCIGQKCK